MLSKNRIKYINSLGVNKYRKKYGSFIVEGHKMVVESFRSSYKVEQIYALTEWIQEFGEEIPSQVEVNEVSIQEMKKISELSSASPVLAVLTGIEEQLEISNAANHLILVLDDIRDPGNLGTIIRTADWFGITNIVCSIQSVDCFNPKVVQSTMGSIFRVNVFYVDLAEYFNSLEPQIPVYGSFLDGENMLETNLSESGVIVIGNEARGISVELEKFVTKKILIPSFSNFEGAANSSPESLNASIATSIVCFEFRRRMNNKKCEVK
ncbi:MAG: RNA methyltransferase [Bacteroidales bacterium]|nr:RNA methyltransferase [Bacteroidales bacterium]